MNLKFHNVIWKTDFLNLGWWDLLHLIFYKIFSDYAVGFGGKFGIQTDRQDKSAVGYDYAGEVPKHHSRVDPKKVFFFSNWNTQASTRCAAAVSLTAVAVKNILNTSGILKIIPSPRFSSSK